MSIYKRNDTFWCAFTLNDRRYRLSTGQTTEREARRFERDKIAALKGEQSVDALLDKIKVAQISGAVSFERALDMYLVSPVSAKRKITIAHVWRDWEAFCVSSGFEFAHDPSLDDAEAYIQTKDDKKLSGRTINLYISIPKAIYCHLLKRKVVLENPFSDVAARRVCAVDREAFEP